ncbi:MAG: LysR substrate-binding domain-containing protein [Janthinobacterium lividum]
MTLDLAYLEDFQALSETGNFSRAALQRAMTQPAFSRRIRALEDWAGTPLFERAAQPIVLTGAGQVLQPVVAEVLRRLLQGRDQLRATASRERATLRFAATHVLSFTFFPTWLRGLENGQPLEAVQLVSDSLHACEQLMLQGQAQFLLCHHHELAPVRLDAARFASLRVGRDVLCPACAPNPEGGPRYGMGKRVTVPTLAYSEESGLGRIIAACRPEQHAAMRRDVVFTSHLAAALRTMALTGRGIAWLPLSLIREDLTAGRLVRAGPPSLDIDMEIRLVRAPGELGPTAGSFWTRLQPELSGCEPLSGSG